MARIAANGSVCGSTSSATALRDEPRRQRDDRDAHGHVHEEDPLPAEVLREDAAEEDAGRGAAPRDRAPDPERLVPLRAAVAEGRVDDREGRGRDDRTAEACDGAEGDQPRAAIREAAHERCEREQRHSEHEHAAAAEHVGRPPAEQQEPAEREGVRRDDPLERALRELEVGRDGGQGHVHDRDVEDDHEERDADEGERVPAARVGDEGLGHAASSLGDAAESNGASSAREAVHGSVRLHGPVGGGAVEEAREVRPSRVGEEHLAREPR